ncbi:hypothetical protein Hanom_Chr14g01306461 [Helianthus anomalus]
MLHGIMVCQGMNVFCTILWCAARSKLNQTEPTSYGWQRQVPLIGNREQTSL